MTNNITPARVVPPGRILQREIDARGWTQKDLAEITNRPTQAINEIIKGTKKITPETARELSCALGTTAEFWTNLETNYRLHLVKKKNKEEEIKRRSRLYTLAPISELIKRQWIKSTDSLDELEKSVCKFLGIDSPQETPQISVNFRHSQILEPKYNAKIAWCKRVEQIVSQQTPKAFQLDKLRDAIPEILRCTEKEEDITKVPQILMDCGVYFVIVAHLEKTYLDGAAFYIENNPVVALTLRYNRIDSFWFSLMHELGHIFAGHQGLYLDNLKKLEENSEEEEANQLACNWLINEQTLNSFTTQTQPKFSKKAIIEFAKDHNRHPGIVLGRLHYDNLVPYKNSRSLLVPVKSFLLDWIYE